MVTTLRERVAGQTAIREADRLDTAPTAPGSQVPDTLSKEDLPTPFFTSVGNAMQTVGIPFAVGRWAKERSQGTWQDDPNFDIADFLHKYPDQRKLVEPIMRATDPTSEGLSGVLAHLRDARSEGEARDVIRQMTESQERLRKAAGNTAGFITGSVLSALIDGAAMVALSPGAAAPAAARFLGVGEMVTETAAGARGLAAARVATVGGLYGAGERAVQSATDPLITDEDLAHAAGLGFLVGGGLGMVFPSVLGNVSARSAEQVVMGTDATTAAAMSVGKGAPDAAAEVASRFESAGAAATPKAWGDLPHKSSDPTFWSRYIPAAIRNPKNVLRQFGAFGRDLLEKEKLEGAALAYQKLAKLVRVSPASIDEVTRAVPRGISAEQIDALYGVEQTGTMINIDRMYKTAHNDIFPDVSALRRTIRNQDDIYTRLENNEGISKRTMLRMADEVSAARALDMEPSDIGGLIPEGLQRTLTHEQTTKLITHVEQMATELDNFYAKWAQRELDAGLIAPEQLVKGYRPQRWNKDVIAMAPDEFEDWIFSIVAEAPDEKWAVDSGLITSTEKLDHIRTSDKTRWEEIEAQWAISTQDSVVAAREARLLKAKTKRSDVLRAEAGPAAERLQAELDVSKAALARMEQRAERLTRAHAARRGVSRRATNAPVRKDARLEELTARAQALSQRKAELEAELAKPEGEDLLARGGAQAEYASVNAELAKVQKALEAFDQHATLPVPGHDVSFNEEANVYYPTFLKRGVRLGYGLKVQDQSLNHVSVPPELASQARRLGYTGIRRAPAALLPKSVRGQGLAVQMYIRAIDDAEAKGLMFVSDSSVSSGAQRVYSSLERRGYTIEKAKNTKTIGDTIVTPKSSSSTREVPVFRVVKRPPELEETSSWQALQRRIAKQEAVISRKLARVDRFNRAAANIEELDKWLRQSIKARFVLKAAKLRRAQARAEVSVEKAIGKIDLLQQSRLIREKIIGNEDPFGMLSKDLTQKSSRFKQRSLQLGSKRFTEEARKFLLTDTEDAMHAYTSSVGREVAFKRVFGNDATPDTLRKEILQDFDRDINDLSRAGGPRSKALIARLVKERKRIEAITNMWLGRWSHQDVGGLHSASPIFQALIPITLGLTIRSFVRGPYQQTNCSPPVCRKWVFLCELHRPRREYSGCQVLRKARDNHCRPGKRKNPAAGKAALSKPQRWRGGFLARMDTCIYPWVTAVRAVIHKIVPNP